MAEYIEREAFLDDIEERYCLPCKGAGKDYDGSICRSCWVDDMCGEVIDAPAADVVPVRHGKWVNKGDYAVCTECGERSGTQYDGVEPIPLMTKLCSNCGAKMDGRID